MPDERLRFTRARSGRNRSPVQMENDRILLWVIGEAAEIDAGGSRPLGLADQSLGRLARPAPGSFFDENMLYGSRVSHSQAYGNLASRPSEADIRKG
jgi:hypothetical protein